jgi:hypothetical protein
MAAELSVRIRAAIEVVSPRLKAISVVKAISVDDCRAVRDKRIVVEDDPSVMAPIETPMMPSPAEAAE